METHPQDIRYVILSDLHLGETISLLTPLDPETHRADPANTSPVLNHLTDALSHLIRQNRGNAKPIFILAGDILGLAYASMTESLQLFEQFVSKLIAPESGIVDRFVYLPGNHDHHIWEEARTAVYNAILLSVPPGEALPEMPHATPPLLDAAMGSVQLQNMVRRIKDGRPGELPVNIDVLYPNLLLTNASGDRGVVIHHGHFVEKIYQFMSLAARALFPGKALPETVEQIEKENFAWIDFGWSQLGSSGVIAKNFEQLSIILQNEEDTRTHADVLAEQLANIVKLPFLPFHWLRKIVARRLVFGMGKLFQGERHKPGASLAKETLQGLRQYFFGPTLRQLRETTATIPETLTFIWGHTHKPYERVLTDAAGRQEVASYNLGGWTVDSHSPKGDLGANILFLNANLDVVALRIFNDVSDAATTPVAIHRPAGKSPGDFDREIEKRLQKDGTSAPELADPWRQLSAAIRTEIQRRRQHHREKFGE